MHKLFVPRFEEKLANIHDWIDRMEAKEIKLLQVLQHVSNVRRLSAQ